MYINKILALANIRVLAFAVLAPVIALTGVSGYIIANQKRMAVEQAVDQSVSATLYAAERELSKHLAAAEILASMVNLDRLDAFTVRITEVMTLRRAEWLNVIVMDDKKHIYNFMRQQRGEPLVATLNPDQTDAVLKTGRPYISPVMVSDRYDEPYIAIRVPIIVPGADLPSHVLTVVIRAWNLTLASQSVLTPPHWRVGVLDPMGGIAGRSAAHGPDDLYIGKVSPFASLPPDSGLILSRSIDKVALYGTRAMSELYPGWSATLGVPQEEIDRAIYGIIYTLGAAGVSTLAIACLLCFVLIRAYARRQTTEALEDSLREKETLLREVHHRVKNNMQGTMGILLFERSRITDAYAKERLRVISERISVQGKVHQHLYEQGDLHRIEIAGFLTELCQSIMASFCLDTGDIKLTIDTDTMHGDIDVAMPLGLITHELMTNAIKHGFKGRTTGEIIITLKRGGDGVVLTVSDTGVGCLDTGECLTEQATNGIGTTLIKGLVRQIDAEFTLMQDITGTTARVVMPHDNFV